MADPPDDHPSPATDAGAGAEPATYAAAMSELEAILDEIEGDAVDVDVLTGQVARAAFLVRWCRERITRARVDVERIVTDLSPDEPAP